VEAVPGSPKNSQLVQGLEAKPVEMSGWPVPRIPLFESSPDSVRIPYEAFRTHAAVASGLYVAFVSAAVVEAVLVAHYRAFPPSGFVPVALGVDLGIGVAGGFEAKRSADALQTAITRYNAALPNP
jgi:hypothetical protein